MLFKPAVVLLTSVLHTAVLARTSATRLGQHADEHPVENGRGATNFTGRTEDDAAQFEVTAEDEEEGENGSIAPSIREVTNDERYVAAATTPGLRRTQANNNWDHGSYAVSETRRNGQDDININIKLPDETRVGDTLFLFLSRTDGVLPLRMSGWTRGAECFKSNNRQDACLKKEHCIQYIQNGKYCSKFRQDGVKGTGKDLGTVLFHKKVTSGQEPGCFNINLPGRSTTWGIVTAISSVNADKPISDFAGTSCDIAWKSVFPSVRGERNDVLLLSQSFDDNAVRSDFLPPSGMTRLGFTSSNDEAGFLYGKKLDRAGHVGDQETRGDGGPKCKDALLSVVVNRH